MWAVERQVWNALGDAVDIPTYNVVAAGVRLPVSREVQVGERVWDIGYVAESLEQTKAGRPVGIEILALRGDTWNELYRGITGRAYGIGRTRLQSPVNGHVSYVADMARYGIHCLTDAAVKG